jgi:hypothetical protein
MRATKRIAAIVAVIAAIVAGSAAPARAELVDYHKSTRDVGGVHVAVLLHGETSSSTIGAYCSLSGNSGVLKEIRFCDLRHGSPTDADVLHRDSAPPSFSNREADPPSRQFSSTPPRCTTYAAYIGYAFNGGTTTIGRTLFINPC